MRILMVNKFLYPKGGAETYIFKLANALRSFGHEIQFFGMEDERNIVSNDANAFTTNMDFHQSGLLEKVSYSLKTIYSYEARREIRKVLDHFQPDAVHLNNFNYQITPSILVEIDQWRKETKHKCKIVYTAHDYQLVCPNHMMRVPGSSDNCEMCIGGHFFQCVQHRCIHASLAKSIFGAMEAVFWNQKKTYELFDVIVCCSHFMKSKLDTNPLFKTKTIAMHNFVDEVEKKTVPKKDYVLYFGRFSEEKGIRTLIQVAKECPDIKFVFAGSGPLESLLNSTEFITNVGFQKGQALELLIREALCTVYPSEWYENCPFSVMESQMYGTPVLGADIGGISELIQPEKTGLLFESGNAADLKKQLLNLLNSDLNSYSINCMENSFMTAKQYAQKMIELYID